MILPHKCFPLILDDLTNTTRKLCDQKFSLYEEFSGSSMFSCHSLSTICGFFYIKIPSWFNPNPQTEMETNAAARLHTPTLNPENKKTWLFHLCQETGGEGRTNQRGSHKGFNRSGIDCSSFFFWWISNNSCGLRSFLNIPFSLLSRSDNFTLPWCLRSKTPHLESHLYSFSERVAGILTLHDTKCEITLGKKMLWGPISCIYKNTHSQSRIHL